MLAFVADFVADGVWIVTLIETHILGRPGPSLTPPRCCGLHRGGEFSPVLAVALVLTWWSQCEEEVAGKQSENFCQQKCR